MAMDVGVSCLDDVDALVSEALVSNESDDLQTLVAQHMSAVQQLVTSQGEHLTRLLAAQAKEMRAREQELQELRSEHEAYREKLLAAGLVAGNITDTGGTGDSSFPQSREAWVARIGAVQQAPLPTLRGIPTGDSPSTAAPDSLPGTVDAGAAAGALPSPKKATDHRAQREMKPPKAPDGELLTSVLPTGESATMQADAEEKDDVRGSTPHSEGSEEDQESEERPEEGRTRAKTLREALLNTDKNQQHAQVFPDAAAMKEKLRKAIVKKEYNVHDFYHETGIFQKIAKNHYFDNFTLLVIGINAIWISVDTDGNTAAVLLEAEMKYFVAENLFCAYFFFEWFVRFMSFKRKRNCLRDGWFVFDSALVMMMVLETWVATIVLLIIGGINTAALGETSILRLFRLLRLSRMARMARLLRAMPELMVMIKAMFVAMRSVVFALSLLIGIIYIFAIVFRQLMDGTDVGAESFSSVPHSINTLLLDGTMPDQAGIVNALGDEGLVYRFIILFYIFLASLTVMNMLVGILCEVVSVVSACEKEEMLMNFVKGELQDMITKYSIDNDGNGQISKKEFSMLLGKPAAARVLQDVGVDVVGLVDFVDYIFHEGEDISFADFMETVLSLRGSNVATVKDIIDLRKMMSLQLDKFEQSIQQKTGTQQGGSGSNFFRNSFSKK